MKKKLLFSVISVSIGIQVSSQKILSSPQSAGTVLDPVSISMQPGFSFKAEGNSVFIAKIGQSTVVAPPNPGTPYTPVNMDYNSGNFSPSENYIYTREYLEATANSNPSTKQIQGIQYFDGLGRPKQTIAIKATPQGNDLVTTIPYDGFGRQADSWLPVPMATQSGGIQGGVDAAAQSYYSSNYKSANGSAETNPFVHKNLENSPLDRLLSVTNPGTDWQNRPVSHSYDAIVANEVLKYTTSTSWNNNATNSSISLSGYYPAASLYKNTVTDEDGNQSIEYKNGQGQTILVRKMLNGSPVDTYYVYNEYDQLAYVIPPLLSAKQIWTLADQDALSYQYRYDGRNRLVEKKLPGKEWEYMVYDEQDRLVSTQDANLRSKGQWLFTKYDQFGRVAYTGITTGGGRASEQSYADVNNAGTNNSIRGASPGVSSSGMQAYYTNDTSLSYPPTIIELLSVNYYDDYPADTSYLPGSIQGENVLGSNPISSSSNANTQVTSKGLAVANYIRNIEKDGNGNYNWTKNYTYYDIKGRAIGTYSQNYMGGYTRTESSLKFSGKPNYVITYHKRTSASQEVSIKKTFEYDHQERLVQHKHQVNGGAETLLAENIYNELGQLKDKNVGDRSQTMTYEYNIRGWMTKLNDPNNLNGRLFGYELKYQNPSTNTNTSARYNGNISQMDWNSQSDGQLRRYDYFYDQLNRLNNAAYAKPNASVVATNAYSESMQYDINGNITNLNRYGGTDDNQAMQIDALSYTYNGNRLQSVKDNSGNYMGYPAGGGNTISYDDNGNMTTELDKGISSITYNYLNLPNQIIQTQGNTMYAYRADGVKVWKAFGSNKNSDYLDGFQYDNNVLEFVPTAEGYYDFVKNAYVYTVVDHLGNVRLSYWKNEAGVLEILEENNYYPFGLKHEGYNNVMANNPANQYKFGGKELQETGMYDFGARMYMPDIGRWGTVDFLAEKITRFSPYNYAFNNPINFIDPDGREGLGWGLKDGVWSWQSDLTADNYTKRGFTEYKDDGSVIENSPIYGKEGGDTGKTYLGFNGQASYLSTDESNGSTGLLGLSNWFRDAILGTTFAIASQFSGGWNSNFARGIVSDSYNVGLTSNVTAFLGVGTTPINFTLLTRGQEPGLYFTPTVNAAIGDGIEGNAGITFGSGMYTGDPRTINSGILQGNTFGASGGLGVIVDGSVGASYAPTGNGNGFIGISGQIGVGIEGSPASVINLQGNYQYTPIVKPVFKFK